MKARLLRKVRKRFVIYFCNGIYTLHDRRGYSGYRDQDFDYFSHALFRMREIIHLDYPKPAEKHVVKIIWPKSK